MERVTVNLTTGTATYADTATSLQVGRVGAVVEVVSNHVYVIGGVSAGTAVRTIERATINTTGLLAQGVLSGARDPLGSNGAVFVIGRRIYKGQAGSYAQGPLYSAPIAVDGTIGTFTQDGPDLWGPNVNGGATVAGGRIWAPGGNAPNTCTASSQAQYLSFTGSGVLQLPPVYTPVLPYLQGNTSHAVLGGFVHIFGGISGTCSGFGGTVAITRSPIASPAWSFTGNLAQPVGSFANVLVVDDSVTVFDSYNRSVDRGTWNGSALSAFTTVPSVIDSGRDSVFALTVVGDNVYALGGSAGAASNTCSVASLPLPPGAAATGAFTEAVSPCFTLPRRYYQRAIAIDNNVYVLGGYTTGDANALDIDRLEMR